MRYLPSVPRGIAAVLASAIVATYLGGDILLYIAMLLVLFVLSPGAH